MSAVLMDSTWESDEAFDTESDEAFDGEDAGEDAGEDFGEASRGRRGRGGRSAYRPGRGVKGLSVPTSNGAKKLAFPKPLATLEETNKGFANVDKARQLVAERLEKLEGKFKSTVKRDSAIIGTVTLGIGVPLTLWGAVQAHGITNPLDGSRFREWAHLKKTDAVAVTSATQVITTSAKYLLDRRYHHSRMGIAADVFAAVQLAAYAVGHLPQATMSPAGSTASLPPASGTPPSPPVAPPAALPAPYLYNNLTAAEAAVASNTLGLGQRAIADGRTYTVIAAAPPGTNALLLEK
jgi:hypothetical protein